MVALAATMTLSGCSPDRKTKTDLEAKGLKGKVKTLEVARKINVGQAKEANDTAYHDFYSEGREEAYKFNEAGYLTESIGGDEWFPDAKDVYEYDRRGNVIEQRRYSKLDGSLAVKWTYKYDDHGNEIECVEMPSESVLKESLGEPKTTITTTYKYNSQGDWIEKTTYENGALDQTVKRTITYY